MITMDANTSQVHTDIDRDPDYATLIGERLRRQRGLRRRWRATVTAWQIVVMAVFLLLWQFLPTVKTVRQHVPFLNRFDISSPTEIAKWCDWLVFGHNGAPLVWSYLGNTLYGAIVGTIVGLLLGAAAGLLLSESPTLIAITRPFILFFNSIPRIALLPVVVLIVGPSLKSTMVNVVLATFFLVFFNAFEGGSSVRLAMIENARLLGARRVHVMLYIRLPYVLDWTFAALPNVISFALVIAVANEWLIGMPGIGFLLLNATTSVQAPLTFALIVILALTGLVLTGIGDLVRNWVSRRLGVR